MRLLRIPEVAEILSVKRARAYELVRVGILPVVRLGRQLRVDPERLDEFLRAGGADLCQDPCDRPEAPTPRGASRSRSNDPDGRAGHSPPRGGTARGRVVRTRADAGDGREVDRGPEAIQARLAVAPTARNGPPGGHSGQLEFPWGNEARRDRGRIPFSIEDLDEEGNQQ